MRYDSIQTNDATEINYVCEQTAMWRLELSNVTVRTSVITAMWSAVIVKRHVSILQRYFRFYSMYHTLGHNAILLRKKRSWWISSSLHGYEFTVLFSKIWPPYLILFGEECKLWSSSLYSFLNHVTFSFTRLTFLLRNFISNWRITICLRTRGRGKRHL
jgi:hypothetical protein